jgi:hypothetical protein
MFRIRKTLMGCALALLCIGTSVYAEEPGELGTVARSTSEVTGKPIFVRTISQKDLESYPEFGVYTVEEVHTEATLMDFITLLLEQNPSIKEVTIASDAVSMTYDSTIDITGFGDRSVERTVTVQSTGDVLLTGPWYAQSSSTLQFDTLTVPAFTPGRLEPQGAAQILLELEHYFKSETQ